MLIPDFYRGRRKSLISGYSANLGVLIQRHRSEVALRAGKQRAEEASQAKSLFLANMSHELRTPLNAILGFSEIIKNDSLGPEGRERYREYASDIHDASTHLLTVINDILDIAKVESGSQDLKCSDTEVEPVIDACLKLVEEQADHQQVIRKKQVQRGLPALNCDVRKIKQMLLNLVANAVKFTPDGGNVLVGAYAEADRSIVLRVVDTGIGMDEDGLERALQPFGQADTRLSRRFEGTGLGLPLAKAFADLHGAVFSIRTAIGRGTDITVRFPPERSVPSAGQFPRAPANGSAKSASAVQPADAPGARGMDQAEPPSVNASETDARP